MAREAFCETCGVPLPVGAKGPLPRFCKPHWRARQREKWRAAEDEKPRCVGVKRGGGHCSASGRFYSPAGPVCARHNRATAVLTFTARVVDRPGPGVRCPTCGR